VLIVKFVVPRKSGRLTDVAGSLMEHVTYVSFEGSFSSALRQTMTKRLQLAALTIRYDGMHYICIRRDH
jgi:hypothetical protein